MNKIKLLLLVLFSYSGVYAQKLSPWKIIDADTNPMLEKTSVKSKIAGQLLIQLDEVLLKENLSKIKEQTGVEIEIPNAKGKLEKFLVFESSNFEPELQAKYPDIRAYSGTGITDKKASLNFSLSPKGIQTMILRGGSGSEFIEPYTKDGKVYVLFEAKVRDKGTLPFTCKTQDVVLNKQLLNKIGAVKSNNQVFKTMRLALSCTGEYATFFGGTVAGALAGMNATMARVNGILNKDLAVKLNIIANNDLIIYTNALTDPYSDGTAGSNGAWNQELQTNLTNTIGSANYDIGHLFGASGGGGNSGCIGCVCIDPTVANPLGKGSAFTSPADGIPQGDTFDIDYVVHEMGHQLGANHTFSYALEGTGVQVEPGSGSTIMGYAGITNYDVQLYSDDYFAYVSILQIQNNLATKSCPVSIPIANSPPTINAGSDWTIPNTTAFVLNGTGSDSDGDTVTYTWEQNDSAITQDAANSLGYTTKPDGPLFRSIYPTSIATRYIPALSTVLLSKLTTTWESVSSIARTLHFTLTGRDNAAVGAALTNASGMIVNVSGTIGPFAVTSQNTPDIGWPQGSNQTITWSVNGSNALAGSTNVNIKLSTDGGLTFPIVLVSNIPNDGSEIITVPNITATNCRILVEPTANIYYAVNSMPFAIGYSVSSACNTYTFPSTPFAIPDGVASYITRTITAPISTETISKVTLNIGLTHSYLSDVEIEVMSPQGTIVKLFDRSCGSTDSSLSLNYDDFGGTLVCGTTTLQTVAPAQALTTFDGINPQGTWTLMVRDAYAINVGTLNAASITICTQTFTLSAPSFEINDFVLYPNPNKGNFNIQFTSKSENGVKVSVNDMLGKIIFENQFDNKANFNENIQLNNAQSGVYFLTVIDGDRQLVKKIVVE